MQGRNFFHFLTLVITLTLFTPIMAQNINGTLMHNGVNRSYFYYKPANYNPAVPAPLILNLHGYTSDNLQQQIYTGFNSIADTAGFIMVYPQGTNSVLTGLPFWNYDIFLETADDIGFLNALIDKLSAELSIDASRVYCTGMSNGGYMSYFMAIHTDRFAAIASVTGSMALAETGVPVTPIPIMEIHGTADLSVPYNGNIVVYPIEQVVAKWVNWNQCDPSPTMTSVPDIDPSDGATAEHYVYKNGIGGNTVEFFKIIDGAHSWPGALPILGVTCQDFNASVEIWRFFSQYSRPELLAIEAHQKMDFQLYPNPAKESFSVMMDIPFEKITIYDLQGKKIEEEYVNSAFSYQVSTSNISNGSYIIEVSVGLQNIHKKLIIQH